MSRHAWRSVVLAAEVGILGVAACHDEDVTGAVDGPVAVQPGDLLSDARIAALNVGSDWRTYVAKSKQLAQADADAITAELRAAGRTTWQPAAATIDFRVTHNLNDSWFASPQATATADNALTFQTPSGGWSKAIGFARARQAGESYSSTSGWNWIGTFDNSATTDELWLLAGVTRTRTDTKYQQGFLRGINYVFDAQMPNGCWPQVYPLEGGYHDAVTFNDAANANILALLSAVAAGTVSFVPSATRAQAATSVQRGVLCILDTQVRLNGVLTIWGQQHDPLALTLVAARAYEPPALTSTESAVLLDVLLSIANPDTRTVAAVHAAAQWLNANAIYGWRYLSSGVLEPASGAGPLWARFYELGTNRPIFGDRDGSVHYDVSEISAERRSGYAWYSTSPAATLARYQTWALSH